MQESRLDPLVMSLQSFPTPLVTKVRPFLYPHRVNVKRLDRDHINAVSNIIGKMVMSIFWGRLRPTQRQRVRVRKIASQRGRIDMTQKFHERRKRVGERIASQKAEQQQRKCINPLFSHPSYALQLFWLSSVSLIDHRGGLRNTSGSYFKPDSVYHCSLSETWGGLVPFNYWGCRIVLSQDISSRDDVHMLPKGHVLIQQRTLSKGSTIIHERCKLTTAIYVCRPYERFTKAVVTDTRFNQAS